MIFDKKWVGVLERIYTTFGMDSSSGMSSLQNQILHKKL